MGETNKKMPAGGSKGGTRFPRLNLDKAVAYSKKLVSKTHTGPQPAKVILPGVFDSAGPSGQVRASALKQYELLEGTPKDYKASALAQKINSATDEDLPSCLKEAFLKPKLFKTLFDTFCNGTTTRAKIRQQAANLDVHPDSLDDCVSFFIDSATFVGLASENGDSIVFQAVPIPITDESQNSDENASDTKVDDDNELNEEKNEDKIIPKLTGPRTNVDIKIDPSMDPEKLDKLLGVLKKYGQI